MHSIKWRCFRLSLVTPNVQTTQIFAFFVAFDIFVVGQRSYFKFIILVGLSYSPSIRTTNRP